jgi:hypothetical protein
MPRHVAVIMDGNGRWAESRGLSRIEGHREGLEAVRAVVRAAGDLDLEYLTLYAFSLENWNRPQAEVAELMRLLDHYLEVELEEVMENDIQVRAIGRLDRLPPSVRRRGQPLPGPDLRAVLRRAGGDRRRGASAAPGRRPRQGRPREPRREDLRRVPLRPRAAGSGPVDPHGGRISHLELPSLADCVL